MEQNNTPIENQGLRNWIKENEKTSIEQWIEESNPYDSQVPVKAFNYGCNKLLTYLGLQDQSDPKKWVEEMKVNEQVWNDRVQMYENTQDRNTRLYEQLQSENKKLKKLISKVRWHTTIHPDSTLMGEIEEALETHPDLKGGK